MKLSPKQLSSLLPSRRLVIELTLESLAAFVTDFRTDDSPDPAFTGWPLHSYAFELVTSPASISGLVSPHPLFGYPEHCDLLRLTFQETASDFRARQDPWN
jgi:hypothetical protein